MDKIPMTAAGYSTLEAELKHCQQIERPRIIQQITEARTHGDEKFDVIQLERKEVHLLVFRRSDVRVHGRRIQPVRGREGEHGRGAPLPRGRHAGARWCSTTARRFPSSCRHGRCAKSPYTEPAVKGDTSGKVLEAAKIATGFEVAVPLFVTTGDRIEIDTRTGEYRRRAVPAAPSRSGAARSPLRNTASRGACPGVR